VFLICLVVFLVNNCVRVGFICQYDGQAVGPRLYKDQVNEFFEVFVVV